MIAKKYTWSWFDGDGVYTNSADSLEEIIEDIYEYYFEDEVSISIKKMENHIEIQVINHDDDSDELHKIDYHCAAVGGFLDFLAREVDRPDKFNIEEMC